VQSIYSFLISSATSELAPPRFVVIYVKDCTLQPWLAGHIIQLEGNFAEDVNAILSLKKCIVNAVGWLGANPSARAYKEKVRAKKKLITVI
jgi:hypothetical protein